MNFIEALRCVKNNKSTIESIDGKTIYFLSIEGNLIRKRNGLLFKNICEEDVFNEWKEHKEEFSFQQALDKMSEGSRMVRVGKSEVCTMICGELSYWDIDNWETYSVDKDIVNSRWVIAG